MIHYIDKTIENLLELDGVRFVINEVMGLWVKFDVQKVAATPNRPHGIKYSLTLHDRDNRRLMGFDNAHLVKHDTKMGVASKCVYDHYHRQGLNKILPYYYEDAAKLLEDFWNEVDKTIQILTGEHHEH